MSMSDKPLKQSDNGSSNGSEIEKDSFSDLAKRFLWADSPDAVGRVILGLSVLCVLLFVLDFIIHRHAYAPGEGLPGFYAVVGFGAFTIIVLGATQLRRLILRNEIYYSPYSVDAEEYPEDGLDKLNHGDPDSEHPDSNGPSTSSMLDSSADNNAGSDSTSGGRT